MRRIYFFDMDGTILPNTTGLLETARYFNTENELLKLENDFRLNLINTTQFTQTIASLWGSISETISKKIFSKAKKLKGLTACIKAIRKDKDYSCIITLSQDFFAKHFKGLGVDYVYSTPYPPNHNNTENLKCLTAEDKSILALELCEKLKVKPEDCVAFGDSSGDLPIFKTVGYAMAVNPAKELSQYTALTYKGNSILEAYKRIKKYIIHIHNKKPKFLTRACKNLNYGRSVIAKGFTDCIKELYKKSINEVHLSNLWLEKIQSIQRMSKKGWYNPPENGMAILFSHDKAVQRSHFSTYRDPAYFSSEVELDWEKGFITGYASNIDTRNNTPGDFGTTVYFGNDTETVKYINRCVYVSEIVFNLLEKGIVKTSAELYNAAMIIFAKHDLEGNSYSATAGLWNVGHTLFPIDKMGIYTENRRFVAKEDDWDLRDGSMFTFEPQYRSPNNPERPKLMHHYVLQFVHGKFKICKKCVHNTIIRNGIVKKGAL